MPRTVQLAKSHDVPSAIEAGLEFLRLRQTAEGFWTDFSIAGESDMWTTAFVAAFLAEMKDSRAQVMAKGALEWLLRTDLEVRWAYSPQAARDCDTTSWVLRLWERLRDVRYESCDGFPFLERHLTPEGGLCTFSEEDFVSKFGTAGVDRRGWYSVHTCVTAAAATLRPSEGTVVIQSLQYLRNTQRADGSWSGYWWIDDIYTTALAIEALSATGEPEDQIRVQRAADWIIQLTDGTGRVVTSHQSQGSPFATGLSIRALIYAGVSCESAGDWLARAQLSDGSWQSSARLRLPLPHEVQVDEARWLRQAAKPTIWNSPLLDQHGIHSSAVAVNALALLRDAS